MSGRRQQPSVFPFDDRADAGALLARELEPEVEEDSVVVGLARGGIVVAAAVARSLALPLDAVAVRKVSHPWQPEYALGAITPSGQPYIRARNGLSEDQLVIAIATARTNAQALDRTLHRDRVPLSLAERSVLLVDDGFATGATMIAAARWARARGARRVVAAAPVGARQTIELLRREADEVVCLLAVDDLGAVGLWYIDFSQVDDREVSELLHATEARPPAPSAG